MSTGKTKIALVGDSLGGGGAEKVQALLSIFFESKGIKVHHIIFVDDISYEYAGELYNLGKQKVELTLDKLKRLKKIKTYLAEHNFDIIIDFRYRVNFFNECLMAHWVYKKPAVYTIHSSLYTNYIPESRFLARLIYKKHRWVAVSKAVASAVATRYKKKVTSIYNPIPFKQIQELAAAEVEIKNPYIVAVGRMNERVKQFDVLIQAFAESILPQQGVQLMLIGSGALEAEWKKVALNCGVQDSVVFAGQQKNPFKYLKKALFTVVSSQYEGLSNVLIESLAVGTPVVSFDCFAGPNEIIDHEINGLLVPNQDQQALTQAINRMIEDTNLYQKCKRNAAGTITHFELEHIGQQWLHFLNLNSHSCK